MLYGNGATVRLPSLGIGALPGLPSRQTIPVAESSSKKIASRRRSDGPFAKLESLTRQETPSTVCLHLCSDGSGIRYSTVTLNFDQLTAKFNAFISVPLRMAAVSLVKMCQIIYEISC